MATTNSEGTIALWNLNERLLIGQKIRAHVDKIQSVFFLLGQSNMVTCGSDNKIVRWYMENEISLPVVGKSIEGHNGEVVLQLFSFQLRVFRSLQSSFRPTLQLFRQALMAMFDSSTFIVETKSDSWALRVK